MLWILTLYILVVALNYLYIKKDKLPDNLDYIVVLSASLDRVTLDRMNQAFNLYKMYPSAEIICCGKYKSSLMEKYLKSRKLTNFQLVPSTNTYEDAVLFNEKIKPKKQQKFAIITSSAHQRRSFHTFQRVFTHNFYNVPTNDLVTIYTPLLPLGWFANLNNLLKDYKYNKKI
jgi:uncharacterized SAM-binding protein YcdF (DUF218 family)